MSAEEIDKAANDMIDSQMFQKPGDLVERDDDTGLMQVESMCMNCHENVSLVPCTISMLRGDDDCANLYGPY